MPIPESQLETWETQGAPASSATTYNSIKQAFESYSWPSDFRYEVYLQGSYANATNIRGNSDVDVIVEWTTAFYSNLTEQEEAVLGIKSVQRSYQDFRNVVEKALLAYYNAQLIDSSKEKSIKLLPASGRLRSDIVPCVSYRDYKNLEIVAEGITFWGRTDGKRHYNYPKIHRQNGETKNSTNFTNGWYKPTVRIFKNAREMAQSRGYLSSAVPSHFIECLLYNIPISKFGNTNQDTFVNCVNYLHEALNSQSSDSFTFQHERWILFGDHHQQWRKTAALDLVRAWITLWNNW